ncbi:MAG TPA: SURF1 family protein [Thauera sp.]|nr:SURF1 family protein [Thauera sp.]
MNRSRLPPSLSAALPLLAGLIVLAVTVSLGNWQVRRAQQKMNLQAVLDDAAQRPPVALAAGARVAALQTPGDPGIAGRNDGGRKVGSLNEDAAGFSSGQRVLLAGEWLMSASIFLDNRTHAGLAGYHVLTPLRLADGSGVVLVNRGWVATGADRAVLPAVPAESGSIAVQGRLQIPEVDPFTLAKPGQEALGSFWQRLDVARVAAQPAVALPVCAAEGAPACLASWIILQTSDSADGLVRDWPLPAAGVDRHRAYAFQWYALAALAAALTAGHAWRLFSRRLHEHRNPRLVGR